MTQPFTFITEEQELTHHHLWNSISGVSSPPCGRQLDQETSFTYSLRAPWPWLVWRGELYVKKGNEIRKWKWSLIPAGYMWTAGLARSVISDLGQCTFKLIFKFLIPSGLMNDDSAKDFSNSLSQGCCGRSQRASAEWEVSIGLQALCRISQGKDFVLVMFQYVI